MTRLWPARLPPRRYTEVSEDTFWFVTEAYSWANRPLLTSQRTEVPVAWTAQQLADQATFFTPPFTPMSEDDFLDNTDLTVVAPARRHWGAPGTVFCWPRATLINPILTIDPYRDAFNDLLTPLAAMNVLLARGVQYETEISTPF